MKNQEDGTVIQRFCIAILQKVSSKEEVIPVFMKQGLIDWVVKLLLRSRITEIHVFCLDFATALLANILHSTITLDFLEKNLSICKNVNYFNIIYIDIVVLYNITYKYNIHHIVNRNIFIHDKRKYINFSFNAYAHNIILFKQR